MAFAADVMEVEAPGVGLTGGECWTSRGGEAEGVGPKAAEPVGVELKPRPEETEGVVAALPDEASGVAEPSGRRQSTLTWPESPEPEEWERRRLQSLA